MDAKPIRVLLGEDDEDDYALLRDMAGDLQGTRIDREWASTYEAALEAMGQNRHDVYLLDYRLGRRTGVELMREAQCRGCTGPIILLTGQGDRDIDVEAMKAGAA